jgi:hypothetical protein
MPAVSLGSVNLSATPSYAAGSKWVEGSGSIGAPRYAIAEHDAAGVDGVGIKRFGFRGRKISIPAIYCNTTEQGAVSAAMADMTTLANTSFTATVAGVQLLACELSEESSVDMDTFATGSTACCRAVFVIEQKRLT